MEREDFRNHALPGGSGAGRKMLGKGLQFSQGLLTGNRGTQPAYDWAVVGVAGVGANGQGQPKCSFMGECETSGHDANHAVLSSVESDRFPQDIWIGCKTVAPDLVAEQGNSIVALTLFLPKECSPHCGVYPQH